MPAFPLSYLNSVPAPVKTDSKSTITVTSYDDDTVVAVVFLGPQAQCLPPPSSHSLPHSQRSTTPLQSYTQLLFLGAVTTASPSPDLSGRSRVAGCMREKGGEEGADGAQAT